MKPIFPFIFAFLLVGTIVWFNTKPVTTIWVNDEANARNKAAQELHKQQYGADADRFLSFNPYQPLTLATPSGLKFEFGLRSDGVVVWRRSE